MLQRPCFRLIALARRGLRQRRRVVTSHSLKPPYDFDADEQAPAFAPASSRDYMLDFYTRKSAGRYEFLAMKKYRTRPPPATTPHS